MHTNTTTEGTPLEEMWLNNNVPLIKQNNFHVFSMWVKKSTSSCRLCFKTWTSSPPPTIHTHTHSEQTTLLYSYVCVHFHTRHPTQWHTHRAWHDMTNHWDCSEMPFGTFWMVPLKRRVEECHFSHYMKSLDVAGQRKRLVYIKLWPHNGQFFRGIHFLESNAITIMGWELLRYNPSDG